MSLGHDVSAAPCRDAGDRGQKTGITEAGLRSRASHQARECRRRETAEHEHDDRDNEVRQPQQQALQGLGHRRKAERVKRDDERDDADQPFRQLADELGRAELHAHLACKAELKLNKFALRCRAKWIIEQQHAGLTLAGVLLTMYDARLNLSRQVAAEAREYFGNEVFDTVVPRNVRLAEAPSFGKPIGLRARNCVTPLSL